MSEKLAAKLKEAGIDETRSNEVEETLSKKAPIRKLGGLVTKRDVEIDYEPPRMSNYGEVPMNSTHMVETRVLGIPVNRKIEYHRGDFGRD